MKQLTGSLLILALVLSNNAIASTCRILDSASYERQYQACQSSQVLATNAVLELLDNGRASKARSLFQKARQRFPDFAPLTRLGDLYFDEQPFAMIARLAEEKAARFNQSYQPIPLSAKPPEKPELPPLPELVKGEFEKTADFRTRVAKAKEARQQQINRIERDYRDAVSRFNQAVEANNRINQNRLQAHKAELERKRLVFVEQAFNEVLGSPQLDKVQYDADREVFYAKVVSPDRRYQESVEIPVPIDNARQFKQQLDQVQPALTFRLVQQNLQLQQIAVKAPNGQYVASLTAASQAPQQVAVTLEDSAVPDFGAIPLLSEQTLTPNAEQEDSYFATALQLEDSPELARLRQQRAEQARKIKAARQAQAREQEIARIEAELDKQKLELASLGSGDYRGIKAVTSWRFTQPAPRPNTLAVIIGNRNYTTGVPKVHYAHNDAKAVKQFVQEVWQLPPENIFYEEDASKGVMEGLFRSTLKARVIPQQTDVLVYFSGHGIASAKDAKLLPVDARPNTARVTGYSRNQLMQELEALNARSYALVLDACYTGTSKEGKGLLPGKPASLRVAGIGRPKQGVVINAARSNEIAWMDDNSGHSLFTYHLLQGLKGGADNDKDRRITSNELESYLTRTVNRAALTLFERSQRPEVVGDSLELVRYQ